LVFVADPVETIGEILELFNSHGFVGMVCSELGYYRMLPKKMFLSNKGAWRNQ